MSLDIFEILFGGARGGGKTEAGIVWIAIPACGVAAHPDYRGLVVRENYRDLLQWIDRAGKIYCEYGAVWRAGEQCFVFPTGGKIHLGHMADPAAFQHYQGSQFHRILWEELTQCADEGLYVRLLGSVRSVVPELRPAVFATANPGGPGHAWVKRRFISPGEPGEPFWDQKIKQWRIFIPSRIEDNPSLREADPGYEALLDGIADEHLRRAWRYGDWDILEGQYFEEWRRERHVCAPFEIPAHWERHVAIDWGYSPDPCAVLFFAMAPKGHVVLWRERYFSKTLPEAVAREILEICPRPVSVVGGPDLWAKRNSPDSSADQMVAAGLYMLERGQDSRTQGWLRVHEYLQREVDKLPLLRAFSTCPVFIDCLPAMIHDPKHPQDARKDSLIDHGPDAARYFLMSKPLPPEEKRPRPVFRDERSRRAHEYLKRLGNRMQKNRQGRGW